MNDSLLSSLVQRQLLWIPSLGIGWYPVTAQPYDGRYFEKYRGYDATPLGLALTNKRIELVRKYWTGKLTDIGIGGGRFMRDSGATGYDINPAGITLIEQDGKWKDARKEPMSAATFWDSLEHIHDPSEILQNISTYLFCSLPIFEDLDHVLRSKHYRPMEHCWYFTDTGFRVFMRGFGFQVLESNRMEEDVGRKDIATYVLCRV